MERDSLTRLSNSGFFLWIEHTYFSDWYPKADLVPAYGPQREILFYAVGHSTRSCSTQWATVRDLVPRSWPQHRSSFASDFLSYKIPCVIYCSALAIYPRARVMYLCACCHVSTCMWPCIHVRVVVDLCISTERCYGWIRVQPGDELWLFLKLPVSSWFLTLNFTFRSGIAERFPLCRLMGQPSCKNLRGC